MRPAAPGPGCFSAGCPRRWPRASRAIARPSIRTRSAPSPTTSASAGSPAASCRRALSPGGPRSPGRASARRSRAGTEVMRHLDHCDLSRLRYYTGRQYEAALRARAQQLAVEAQGTCARQAAAVDARLARSFATLRAWTGNNLAYCTLPDEMASLLDSSMPPGRNAGGSGSASMRRRSPMPSRALASQRCKGREGGRQRDGHARDPRSRGRAAAGVARRHVPFR